MVGFKKSPKNFYQGKSPLPNRRSQMDDGQGDEQMEIDGLSSKKKKGLNASMNTPNSKNMHVSFQLPNSSPKSAPKAKHPPTPMPKRKSLPMSAGKNQKATVEFPGMNQSLSKKQQQVGSAQKNNKGKNATMQNLLDKLNDESDDDDDDDEEDDDEDVSDEDSDESDEDLRKTLMSIKQKQLAKQKGGAPQKQALNKQKGKAGIPTADSKKQSGNALRKLTADEDDEDDDDSEDDDDDMDEEESDDDSEAEAITKKLMDIKQKSMPQANKQKLLKQQEDDESELDSDDEDDDETDSDAEEIATKLQAIKQKKLEITPQKPNQKSNKNSGLSSSTPKIPAQSAGAKGQPQKAEAVTSPAKTQIEIEALSADQERKRQRDARNLFIRNLPADVTIEELKTLSADIVDVRIPQKKSWRKARNVRSLFAFVEFANEKKAEDNYVILQKKKFRGEQLYLDFVGEKSKRYREMGGKKMETPRVYDMRKLFVTGLPVGATIDQVASLFPKAFNIAINSSADFRNASVLFRGETEAAEALKASEKAKIAGKQLTVLYATTDSKGAKKKTKEKSIKFC